MADRSGDDKTAIENKQNLIVDGYYIPFDWEKNFTTEYLQVIKYFCFVMSENYIKNHFKRFFLCERCRHVVILEKGELDA